MNRPEAFTNRFLSLCDAPFHPYPALNAPEGCVIGLTLTSGGPSLDQQIFDLSASAAQSRPKGLMIGPGDLQSAAANAAVEALIAHNDALRSLEVIYLGPLEFRHFHKNQVIDLSRLLHAFPGLRVFALHVGSGGWDEAPCTLNRVRHIGLEHLLHFQPWGRGFVFEDELIRCIFPNLKQLDFEYEGPFETGDAYLRPLFGNDYPSLRHLRCVNSMDADDIAIHLSASPVLGQLETLDLSNGWLTDDGAGALRDAPGITSLRKLTIERHFVSPGVISELKTLVSVVEEVPADPEDEDWEEVKRNCLYRRIRKHAGDEYIIRLDCLPHHELSVLSEVVIEGKVRFFDDITETEYLGEILENPTWLDIALEANRMQRSIGDYHHVFLENWWVNGPDPELPGVLRAGLGCGS